MIRGWFWNPHQARLRAFWRLLIFLAIALAVALPLLLAIDVSGNSWLQNSVEQPAVAVGFLLALWLSIRFIDRRPREDFGLGFTGGAWWRDLGVGLGLGTTLMSLIFLVQYWAGWITITDFAITDIAGVSFGVAVFGQLLRAVGTSFFEELLLRSYLLRILAEGLTGDHISRKNAVLFAWVFTSAIFGVLHLGSPNANLLVALNIVFAGLFLGFGMVYTGSLAIPIGIHISWNFIQVTILGFGSSGRSVNTSLLVIDANGPELWAGGSFGPEGGLLSLGAFGFGIFLVWLRIKRQSGKPVLCLSLADPPS